SSRLVASLLPKVICQWLQSAFDGKGCFGFPLGLVWEIKVLELGLAVTIEDFGPQIVGQLSLFLDRTQDPISPAFEIGIVLLPVLDIADFNLIEIAGGFLAVSRNERNSRSVFE